jgi:hypothetical protein
MISSGESLGILERIINHYVNLGDLKVSAGMGIICDSQVVSMICVPSGMGITYGYCIWVLHMGQTGPL